MQAKCKKYLALLMSVFLLLSVVFVPGTTVLATTERTWLQNGTFDSNTSGWSQISNAYGTVSYDNGRLKYVGTYRDPGNANSTSYIYQEINLKAGQYTWDFDIEKSAYGQFLYFGVYDSKAHIGNSGIFYDKAKVYYTQSSRGDIGPSLNTWIDVPTESSTAVNMSAITATTFLNTGANNYCATYTGHQAEAAVNTTSIIKVSYTFTLSVDTAVFLAVGNECRANDSEDYYFYFDNAKLTKERYRIENGTFDADANEWSTVGTTNGTITWDTGRLRYDGTTVDVNSNQAKNYVYQRVNLKPGYYTWTFDIEKSPVGQYLNFGIYTEEEQIGKTGMIYGETDSASFYATQNKNGNSTGINVWTSFPKESVTGVDTSAVLKPSYVVNTSGASPYEYLCVFTGHDASGLTTKAKVEYNFTITEAMPVYFAVGHERRNSANEYYFYLDNAKLDFEKSRVENGTFDSHIDYWHNISDEYGTVSWEDGRLKYVGKYQDRGNALSTSYVYQEVKLPAGVYNWTFDMEKSSYGLYAYFGVYDSKANIGKSGMIYDSASVYYTTSASTSVNSSLLNKWTAVPSVSSGTLDNSTITANSYFVNAANTYCATYTAHQANSNTSKIKVSYNFTLADETTVYLAVGNDCRENNTANYYFYLDNVVLDHEKTTIENGDFDENIDGWKSKNTDDGLTSWENGRLKYKATVADTGNTNAKSFAYQKVSLAAGSYTWSFDIEKSKYGNYFYFGVFTDSQNIGKSGMLYKSASVSASQCTSATSDLDVRLQVPFTSVNSQTNTALARNNFENGSQRFISVYTGQNASGNTTIANVYYSFAVTSATDVYFAVGTECRASDTENYYFYLDNVKLEDTLLGNVYYDGYLNAYDLSSYVDYLLSKDQDDFHYETADLNDDAALNIVDYVMIKKAISSNTKYETISFSKKSQEGFEGLCGVVPCYWFLPDSTLNNGEGYTAEQLETSTTKLMQMGMSKVRCLNFEPAYAWDADNDEWDWDSESMQGFYNYCDLMQNNNIEIILNTAEGINNPTSKIGTENPIPIVAAREEITPQEAYGNWVVDFVEEVIIDRGYDNIKYWEEGTEPNNSSVSKTKFDSWKSWLIAAEDAVTTAGYRTYLKFVGPSNGFRLVDSDWQDQIKWVKWATTELDEYIDIYACHTYLRTEDCTGDYYSYWKEFIDSCNEYISITGKPFWVDEFNVANYGDYVNSAALKNDPLHATQVSLAQLSLMTNGIGCAFVWYPVEIKFPNTTKTGGEFENGIHKVGLDRSVLESDIPYNAYYAYTLLGTAIKDGDTVYEGNNTTYGMRTMLLEHSNGKYSIVAINMSWDPNVATFTLPAGLENATFTKAVYDPVTFTASASATPIAPTGTRTVSSNQFVDQIGGYQVVVYNQQ